MPFEETKPVAQEYRVALVRPGSSELLVVRTSGGLCLPHVSVSLTDRPAEVLQESIRTQWGIPVYITDYLPFTGALNNSPCVLGEVLETSTECRSLEGVVPKKLAPGQMNEEELREFELWLQGRSKAIAAVGRLGWINEVYEWAEAALGAQLAGRETVRQWNMGGGFVLLRLQTIGGRYSWLKATSGPNAHEYQVTKLIAKFAEDALPKIIASRDDWSAWLMADGLRGHNSSGFEDEVLDPSEYAVRALARLQARSIPHIADLLNAGAFDQRRLMTEAVSRELFEYLAECMELQQSQKTAPLDRKTLEITREAYLRGCDALQGLQVPLTLLHGDLTGGNVVCSDDGSVFLDWAEAYIGFPIGSLHHLRMFFERNGADESTVHRMALCYRDEWSKWADATLPLESFQWAPLMAAASTLYGRGDWLRDREERERPARRSYCRTLARHMARAAQGVSEGVALWV